jgi:hypothetical protein
MKRRRGSGRGRKRLTFYIPSAPSVVSLIRKRKRSMAIDYKKLTTDLIKAREAAEEAGKGEDGGTANLDTMTISIPRANEKKVIEAVQAAGLHTSGRENWIGSRFFISPPRCGQGNSRVRATEAMAKVMREAGWDVLMYCKMD